MATLAELKEKLGELVQDSWATPEEIKACQNAIAECEKQMASADGAEFSKEDFDTVVQVGKALGIDANITALTWGDIRSTFGEQANLKIALELLSSRIEAKYLRMQIAELNQITAFTATKLQQLARKSEAPETNGKKKGK